jgi:hypothetical protein
MKAPNAVKKFLWRACKNILPTKNNLLRKRVVRWKCGENDFHLFAEITRKLWLRRNSCIYEGSFTHHDGIAREAERAVNEFDRSSKQNGGPPVN